METITNALTRMWNETSLVEAFFGVLVLTFLIYSAYRRFVYRCPYCGERVRKIHPDTNIWERITDKLTPEWQYERDYSPGVYECKGCRHRSKHLSDESP